MSNDLIERLHTQASEIAGQRINGWGNTMTEAAEHIAALELALAEQRNIAFAAQKEAARLDDLEKSNDRLCERLVIAQKHMTGKQKDAFEAEWRKFMDTLR